MILEILIHMQAFFEDELERNSQDEDIEMHDL
jgi:hypothetical protein